jgi:predicted enzyme related to lactoylglutathione lyase
MGRILLAALAALVFAGAVAQPASAPTPGPLSEDGSRRAGKFIWYELITDEPEAAQRFYATVFGWTFRPVPGVAGSYTLIENAGDRVGGMFVQARPAGGARGARWIPVMSVPDAGAAVEETRRSGGSVIAPLATIAGRGRHALLSDPEGVLFGVLRTEGGDPADTPVEDGDFFWLDLFARDPERAATFYRRLGGYEVDEAPAAAGATRLVLQAQGYARAGVLRMPPGLSQPGWLPYVLVEDVPATLKKVVAAGGRIVVQPDKKLLDGKVAVIVDASGGVLGIIDWERP